MPESDGGPIDAAPGWLAPGAGGTPIVAGADAEVDGDGVGEVEASPVAAGRAGPSMTLTVPPAIPDAADVAAAVSDDDAAGAAVGVVVAVVAVVVAAGVSPGTTVVCVRSDLLHAASAVVSATAAIAPSKGRRSRRVAAEDRSFMKAPESRSSKSGNGCAQAAPAIRAAAAAARSQSAR